MAELEHRLQRVALDESAAYQPSPDLPERIGRRVRARRRRAQALAAGGALAAAALLAVVVTQLPGDDEQGVVATDPSTTTTTEPVPSTTTSSTTTTVPDSTTTTVVPPPLVDERTPLNAKGIGPIEAGMTVAQAEAVSGLSFTLRGSTEEFGGCFYVDLEGQPDLAIRASNPAGRPDAPFEEGVIEAITIYELEPDGVTARATTAGIGLGASEAEVRAAHGDAVEERPHDYVPEGAYLYVHPDEAPGFGFRYVLDEHRVVTSIDVGLEGAITAPEGCV